jgi:hypothetical protein
MVNVFHMSNRLAPPWIRWVSTADATLQRCSITSVFVKSAKCGEEQHIGLLCHYLLDLTLGFLGLLIRILGGDM